MLLSTITSLVLLVLGAQAVAIGDVSSPVDLLERDTSPNLEGRQSGSPITWNEWTCGNPSGGGGHTALKNVHAGFNRVFGGPRLTAVAGQCYVANCHGHFFAWCNTSGYTKTEAANHRNLARNANPGNGGSCRYLRFSDSYSHYYFGKGNGNLGGKVDRRKC